MLIILTLLVLFIFSYYISQFFYHPRVVVVQRYDETVDEQDQAHPVYHYKVGLGRGEEYHRCVVDA